MPPKHVAYLALSPLARGHVLSGTSGDTSLLRLRMAAAGGYAMLYYAAGHGIRSTPAGSGGARMVADNCLLLDDCCKAVLCGKAASA